MMSESDAPNENPSPAPSGRYRRRYRRIVGMGGRIPSAAVPKAVPFKPTPVNEAEYREWVLQQARELVPGAVDEVLGYALDNAINARADQWAAQVYSEFAQYLGRLKFLRNRADSTVVQERQLQPPDSHRFIETETARNTAAARLRGEDEKAAWSEPGHADPTLLGGHPRSGRIYLLALLVAAAADIAAFYQVIQLVLGDLSTAWVIVLVIGFTGTALATAHFIGIMLRDRRAGAKWIQDFLIVIVAAVWLALGALAFWVRLRSNTGSSGSSVSLSVTGSAGTTASTNVQGTVPGAAMFAGLYAATGIIALVGGYLNHNPLFGAFMRAKREHRAASDRHAASAGRLKMAEAERGFYEDQITAAERVRDEAIQARLALAAELKQLARLELAKRLRDTSATDMFLQGDARPYTYRPFPASRG
jgi:hypothetical protein